MRGGVLEWLATTPSPWGDSTPGPVTAPLAAAGRSPPALELIHDRVSIFYLGDDIFRARFETTQP